MCEGVPSSACDSGVGACHRPPGEIPKKSGLPRTPPGSEQPGNRRDSFSSGNTSTPTNEEKGTIEKPQEKNKSLREEQLRRTRRQQRERKQREEEESRIQREEEMRILKEEHLRMQQENEKMKQKEEQRKQQQLVEIQRLQNVGDPMDCQSDGPLIQLIDEYNDLPYNPNSWQTARGKRGGSPIERQILKAQRHGGPSTSRPATRSSAAQNEREIFQFALITKEIKQHLKNQMEFQKFLEPFVKAEDVKTIRSIRQGFLIALNNRDAAVNLMEKTNAGTDVKLQPTSESQAIKRAENTVVASRVPEAFTNEYITEKLGNVSSVVTFTKREGDTVRSIGKVKITFDNPEDAEKALREGIKIGFTKIEVQKYVPLPQILQCRNCYAFGHRQENCSTPPKCPQCNQQHKKEDCPMSNSASSMKYICANCSGEHPATSKLCQTYVNYAAEFYQKRGINQTDIKCQRQGIESTLATTNRATLSQPILNVTAAQFPSLTPGETPTNGENPPNWQANISRWLSRADGPPSSVADTNLDDENDRDMGTVKQLLPLVLKTIDMVRKKTRNKDVLEFCDIVKNALQFFSVHF